jgi:hypothetical protein
MFLAGPIGIYSHMPADVGRINRRGPIWQSVRYKTSAFRSPAILAAPLQYQWQLCLGGNPPFHGTNATENNGIKGVRGEKMNMPGTAM